MVHYFNKLEITFPNRQNLPTHLEFDLNFCPQAEFVTNGRNRIVLPMQSRPTQRRETIHEQPCSEDLRHIRETATDRREESQDVRMLQLSYHLRGE